MILGIGVDITEIEKIERGGDSETFLRRLFTAAELRAVADFQNRFEHLAGKFAAKEAFMKALGAGIRQEVGFTQIEVLNEESGRPHLTLSGEAKARLAELGAQAAHVSISHSGGMAVAVVILEC